MTTLTITRDHLDEVRPGDRLVALDDVTLGMTRVFTGTIRRVGRGQARGIPYRVEDSKIEGHLYPDTHVERSIVVERPEPTPFGRCAECGHRMEADENTCTPCTEAERARLDAALAPKKARKPVIRTIDGLRLVSRDGAWWTEDSRYEIRTNYGGITECDADHPVRITSAMRVEAQAHPTRAWAQPILSAIQSGKSGYYCYEGTEHQAPDTWIVWDHERNDYAGDFGSHAESFTEAARYLARYLRKEG